VEELEHSAPGFLLVPHQIKIIFSGCKHSEKLLFYQHFFIVTIVLWCLHHQPTIVDQKMLQVGHKGIISYKQENKQRDDD
jgi:hypothetical protein